MKRTLQIAAIGLFAAIAMQSANAAMVQFKSGEILTAADLNQNFTIAEQRIDAQEKELAELKLIAGGLAAVSAAALGLAFVRRRRG